MGIDISTWRLRIGVFSQKFKVGCKFQGFKTSIGRFRLTFRLCTCLLVLLVVCGDVEENPGPPKTQRNESRRQSHMQSALNLSQSAPLGSSSASAVTRHAEPPTGKNTEGVTTRQRTISSYANVVSSPLSSNNESGYRSVNDDIYDVLMTMKSDMNKNNDRIITDLKQVHSKIDTISDTVRELRADNESLRRENSQLKMQISDLQLNVDRLDGNMKRKNLRIQGISGQMREPRSVTEQKAREFLQNNLKCENASTVQIDDIRRVKSSNSSTPTILLTFCNYVDCTTIMQLAKSNLQRDSNVYIQYDYTDRVRRHRKILGERMIEERQHGNYSSVRYDKLIINDGVYKYSDNTQSIVYIGRRQSQDSRRPSVLAEQNEPFINNQSQQAGMDTERSEVDQFS